jgi:hypothetical protein
VPLQPVAAVAVINRIKATQVLAGKIVELGRLLVWLKKNVRLQCIARLDEHMHS